MEINLKYLCENFLTLEEVSEKSSVSGDKIKRYIVSGLVPKHSYEVSRTVEITSSLTDKHSVQESIYYFPTNYVELIKNCESRNSEETKKEFIDTMRQHLQSHKDKALAYENAVSDESRLEQELENEWNHYQNGIYGICTLTASPKAIVEKEIAVKKLIGFLEENPEDKLKNKKEELVEIVAEYDAVSSLFAPYQRELSSRGKYVDRPLKKIGFNNKIKSY